VPVDSEVSRDLPYRRLLSIRRLKLSARFSGQTASGARRHDLHIGMGRRQPLTLGVDSATHRVAVALPLAQRQTTAGSGRQPFVRLPEVGSLGNISDGATPRASASSQTVEIPTSR
jgi:hypothetical protein